LGPEGPPEREPVVEEAGGVREGKSVAMSEKPVEVIQFMSEAAAATAAAGLGPVAVVVEE
jgi:hypothetical protein